MAVADLIVPDISAPGVAILAATRKVAISAICRVPPWQAPTLPGLPR